MNSPQTPSRPSRRQYPQRLTRDQRVQVSTLANEGYSRREISQILVIRYRQVCYTLENADLSPKNSTGRTPVLSKSQVDEIESFVCSSPENRQMSYLQLANFVFRHFGVSEKVIRREMKKRGYTRQVAAAKPPLSPENMRKRFQFASSHLLWEKDDRMRILWTDET
ncbi:hypothetical protein K3495_g9194 [Podosphaera aphanis]|nr:hypothetical protein K3495_g9194 [Podosphaera aphanis]